MIEIQATVICSKCGERALARIAVNADPNGGALWPLPGPTLPEGWRRGVQRDAEGRADWGAAALHLCPKCAS